MEGQVEVEEEEDHEETEEEDEESSEENEESVEETEVCYCTLVIPRCIFILCPLTLLFTLFKHIQVFIEPTPQPDSSKAPEQPEPPKVTPVLKVNGRDKVDRQLATDRITHTLSETVSIDVSVLFL